MDVHPALKPHLFNVAILPFRDLPETHQLALAHYMSVDGAAWAYDHPDFKDWVWGEGTPYDPVVRLRMLDDLRSFLPRFVQHFGDQMFGMAEVKCDDLEKVIADNNPDYDCVGYAGMAQLRGDYELPTWPSILVDSEQILQDGWTRFYDRMALGTETTPIVWYEN